MSEDEKYPPVLDACCGSRMFWFNKADPRCLYVDKRRETYTEPNDELVGGIRTWHINPDTLADFTSLPFPDNTFAHVVFDPPHCLRNGEKSRTSALYGDLRGEWREMLRKGFSECFRVLRPDGVLVFKWNDLDVPVREVLALTPERPLYGHTSRRGGTAKCGGKAGTHWIAFLKPNAEFKSASLLVSLATICSKRCVVV